MATTRKNTNNSNTAQQIDWYKMDLSDLVTVTEMAKRADKPVPQMSNMATKTKGFPKPLNAPGIAGRVYFWPDVENFLSSREQSTTEKKVSERDMLLARLKEIEAQIKAS